MVALLKITFILSLILFLHSYLFYPISLEIINFFKRKKNPKHETDEHGLPIISCITSVYNESSIIESKLISLLESDYPKDKLNVFVGSDCSADGSDEIIHKLTHIYSNLNFFPFKQRRGKASVINDLLDEALKKNPNSPDHIILYNDANVILCRDTIKKLIRNFQDKDIVLVDSRIIPENLRKDGISKSEDKYMNLEIRIKNLEGEIWGAMMGAFGGCFSIRSNFTTKVPVNFLMDDFYISMSAMQMGGKCINDLDAVCYEGIPNQIQEEFRRKTRISAGNFQNLTVYYNFLISRPVSRAYAFFSHKVLRWIGPFLLISIWLSALGLAYSIPDPYLYVFYIINIFYFVLPIADWILSKIHVHVKVLRGIRYFILMNFALLNGFIKFIKGIQNSAWQPPKRTVN